MLAAACLWYCTGNPVSYADAGSEINQTTCAVSGGAPCNTTMVQTTCWSTNLSPHIADEMRGSSPLILAYVATKTRR
ncbi:hypothetical protein BV25DRAFT_1819866 [Artomyces pyxidatus]|uniref:Uncharacterized protein n=1 Tax=Artomyces pyxidatus TaxID=48021 RepID=A0ACB8TEC8_9AGAM|nr:hypothetical protein BV25DRAFT_1819866 [Artomyces pyxidatus]